MNDELQYHKRSDSIKWILTLIAFILIGIVLIGIICGWFDRKPKEAEEQVPEGSTSGMVVSDAMKSEGISLAMTPIPIENYADHGISPIAVESAVTVTATVEPATTTYPALYWGVHFLDADSVWEKRGGLCVGLGGRSEHNASDFDVQASLWGTGHLGGTGAGRFIHFGKLHGGLCCPPYGAARADAECHA